MPQIGAWQGPVALQGSKTGAKTTPPNNYCHAIKTVLLLLWFRTTVLPGKKLSFIQLQ